MDKKNKNLIKALKFHAKHEFKKVMIFSQHKQTMPKFHAIFNEMERMQEIPTIKKPTTESILSKNGMDLNDKIDMLKYHNPKLYKLLA